MNRAASRRFLVPALLFALALVMRLIGLRWGLPSAEHWYSYHPDERQIAVAIVSLNFFGGDFNPDFFNYPSLYIYLVYIAQFLGSGFGIFSTQPSGNVVWPFLHNVILSGRFVTALLGAATVPLVFFLGRQIGGARCGVLAALLLAFLPGHVQHSHFATVDVPATFFVTLSLFFAARALQPQREEKGRQLLLAAFVAGLAAATKYNAGLVIVAVLVAWWLSEKKRDVRSLALIPAMAVLGFLLGCPFSVLDFSTFWGDCKNQGVCYELLVHPGQGHGLAFVGTGNGWWYHLTFNLPFAMTWPVVMAAIAGLALVARQHHKIAWPLFIWVLLYVVSLGFSQVRFLRYLLPILPALCLFAAFTVIRFGASRRRLSAALGGLLLVFVLIGAFDVLSPFVTPDPRDQAAQWMRQHASTPTSVGLLNPPWFWTPPLSPQDAPPGSGLSITQSPDGKFQFAVTGFDAAQLEAQKPQWFVMNEFEYRDEARLRDEKYQSFLARLNEEYSLRKQFKNQPPFTWPGRSFAPHDWLYTNPEVQIYERRAGSTTSR